MEPQNIEKFMKWLISHRSAVEVVSSEPDCGDLDF